jgi:hypothetical protein
MVREDSVVVLEISHVSPDFSFLLAASAGEKESSNRVAAKRAARGARIRHFMIFPPFIERAWLSTTGKNL